jgi:hypothetical protein
MRSSSRDGGEYNAPMRFAGLAYERKPGRVLMALPAFAALIILVFESANRQFDVPQEQNSKMAATQKFARLWQGRASLYRRDC